MTHEPDWEFMGHGHVQRPMHKVEDQRAAIADSITAITSPACRTASTISR
jgi:hypothetical protein